MRRVVVLFSITLSFFCPSVSAGCSYYLQTKGFAEEAKAKALAKTIQSRHAAVSTRLLSNRLGYSVYLVNNAWSRARMMQLQKRLLVIDIDTVLQSSCVEKVIEPVRVSEDRTQWPYRMDMKRTMAAVSLDAVEQTKPKFLNLREAMLLGLRFAPDVKNAEIDQIIRKYDLRLNDWQFEWQYTLEGQANWSNTHSHAGDSTSHSYSLNTTANKTFMTGTHMNVGVYNQANGNTYNPKLQVSASQPLLRASSKDIILNNWYNTRDSNLITRLNYQQTLMARMTDIIKNYRQLIINNNNLGTAKQALNESRQTLEHNKLQIKLGRMARTVNIPQASQVESNKLSLEQTRNQILQSKQTLLQSIGVDPDELIEVPNDVAIKDRVVPDEQATIEYAIRHNIDYQIKLINLRVTKRGVDKARDDLRWELDANMSASVGSTTGYGKDARLRSLSNGRNHDESAGLSLKIPLGRKDLQYALAKQVLALEKEKNSLYRAKRDLITTVKNMLINIRSQLRQLDIAERALALARQTYKITAKKQQLGRASSLDVTQSQNDLIQKRINLIQTKVSYLNAMTDLDVLLAKTLDRWQIKLRE